MSEFNQTLWTLDSRVDSRTFEELCVDLLYREGYRHIVPIGGQNDRGRDAEIRYWKRSEHRELVTVFQFSLEERWESKLKNDTEKIKRLTPTADEIVFVTSRKVTGAKRDKLAAVFRSELKLRLTIYDRDWIRIRLEESHPDLASKYLGLESPQTVCHSARLVELSDFDGELSPDVFQTTSAEMMRASILESTRKEPTIAKNWRQLAKIESHLRNWDAALYAVAQAIKHSDDLTEITNLKLHRGALLAEKGIAKNSRPLLVEALEIFVEIESKLERSVDNYNIANVLGSLGRSEEAEMRYRRCLAIQPDYSRAWKNLGSLILPAGRTDEAIGCFDKALSLNPAMVEALLSKATALVMFRDDSKAAVPLFEQAYRLDPDLDRKWTYTRYWFSYALLSEEQYERALQEVDRGLLLQSGDLHYLNQKAAVLSEMRARNGAFQSEALKFFQFRAHALREDFPGLDELIQIYSEQGRPNDVWPFINANLPCDPFELEKVALEAQISLSALQQGFRNCGPYRTFRDSSPLRNHLEHLRNHGLRPSTTLTEALGYLLMAPFGELHEALREARESDPQGAGQPAFERCLVTVGRIIAGFGPLWLCSERPSSQKEQVDVLSLGMALLRDIVVTEAARQYGYLVGHLKLPQEWTEHRGAQNLNTLCADAMVRLFERVAIEWDLAPLERPEPS